MDADKKFQVRRMEFTPKREPGESTGPEGTQRGTNLYHDDQATGHIN